MPEVTLTHPIKANGETLEVLTLEEPRVKHLRAVAGAKDEIERACLLIGELAGLPPSAVDQIHASDFATLSEVIAVFFEKPQTTGGA